MNRRRNDSSQDHQANRATEPKEVKAMQEQDLPSNEERDLERLFADDLGAEALPSPPPDLAERIKAEIPDNLGAARTAPKTGVVVPFRRYRTVLALAATAMLAAALWLATPRNQTTGTETLVVAPTAADQGATQPQEGVDYNQPVDSIQEEPRSLQRQIDRARVEVPKPPAPMAKKIPIPDPTPGEPIPVAEREMAARSAAPPTPPARESENRRLEEVKAEPEGPLSLGDISYGVPASPPESEFRPPNDQAHDAMYFDSAGVNPFVDSEDDALSTFGLDVDTAGYTVVRRYLQDGNLPPQDAVRVEEMLNFFDYGDEPPSEAEGDFSLTADVAPSRWAPDDNRSERYYLVRFGLRARDVIAAERPPALLTFVVDVSGSMDRENRLGLVKRSLGLLLDHLREDDRVALVVYGSRGRVLLEPTSNHEAVRQAIGQLVPEGSTNAAEGLRLGYELTARHRRPGAIHRIILCSDGVANTGSTTSGEGILGEVERWGRQGVELTTVGFGMGNYNDTLMETLADRGNGRYAYIDTIDEARRLFVDDLTGTLTTVAAEARAQVEFDPKVVSRYRLLGYENRDIADERFRDDTVDAGEIGAGHVVTALYEVKTREPLKTRDRLATLTLRYASIAKREMTEQSLAVTGKGAASRFAEAPRALRLAATVAEFAEVLRGSYWARDVDLAEVFAEAQKVSAEWPGDLEVAEFATLVGKADRLRRQEN